MFSFSLHKEQLAFQQTDHYKLKAKERYKIEAKNSELKNIHGYGNVGCNSHFNGKLEKNPEIDLKMRIVPEKQTQLDA